MEVPRNPSEHRIRQQILEQAVFLLGEKGLYISLLEDAAELANCNPAQYQPYFTDSRDLVFALYLRQANEWKATVAALPPASLANRFRAAMHSKLDIVAPHREAIRILLTALANPRDSLGVFNSQTELVRSLGLGVMGAVIHGATGRPISNPDQLARTLYITHLALMLLWTRDTSPGFRTTYKAIAGVAHLLEHSPGIITLRAFDKVVEGAARGFTALLGAGPSELVDQTARRILKILFRHRRLLPPLATCAGEPCEACMAMHLPALHRFVAAGKPIHMVLPAFPAKSPSPYKVLGKLPDMAEVLGLEALNQLCAEITEIYPPGARLTICSDGHVFSDQVHVPDEDVTAYSTEIRRLIEEHNLAYLDTFSMSEVFTGLDFEGMRQHLCLHYAEDQETIRQRTKSGALAELFNGIHRFLFEDEAGLENDRSRTQIRTEAKERAYEVMRRSDAWGRLLADCFGASIRLSIHPQPSHGEKIGILLGEARDIWITPWHGVAVKKGGRFVLQHRHEAESSGARPVLAHGRPYYYESEATP
jgi:pyoverdine/dityrosine biosynthesis protein Dit1/AcrR family transcriptional regulator